MESISDFQSSLVEMKNVSLSMFRKGFFGIFHGSISRKIDSNKFIINKKDAIFDSLSVEDMILLYTKKDYRWNDASSDSDIHLNIYKNIPEAKFVCYAMPANTIAYSLVSSKIYPQDYFGYLNFKKIKIYDMKQVDDWYERAPFEIYKYMIENQTNIIVIRGYGVYAYARTLYELAKNVALLENSCKLLLLKNLINN